MTVLALLLSLLLGTAPAAAAAAESDRSAVRHGKSEANKAGAVLRTGGRVHADDSDGDELLAAAPPRAVSGSLWSHPAEIAFAGDRSGLRAPLAHAYLARAPPAA